jgi:AcrR family transcriptional regulator
MRKRANSLTRQEWVDTAYSVIEDGNTFSTRAIASRVGATTGSFYHHFENREDLVLDVNRKHIVESRAFLHRADTVGEPRERLRAFVVDVFSAVGYLRADLALEAERGDLEVDKMSRHSEDEVNSWMRQTLLDVGFDSKEASRQIALMRATHLGMASSIVVHGAAWTAYDRGQLADTLVDAVLASADCRER